MKKTRQKLRMEEYFMCKNEEKKYNFYGWEGADCEALTNAFSKVKTQKDLYDCLLYVWCSDTCVPRLRASWKEENKTLGQCSITSFLVQDIFGGEVRGILRPGGNYHCFNEVNGVVFDLTSEQFGEEKLDYDVYEVQSREKHFSDADKYSRYLLLKEGLLNYCNGG